MTTRADNGVTTTMTTEYDKTTSRFGGEDPPVLQQRADLTTERVDDQGNWKVTSTVYIGAKTDGPGDQTPYVDAMKEIQKRGY